MAECRRCSAALLHCHGTLVHHDDGTADCTDEDCAGDVALHDFVMSCFEINSGCCADVVPVNHRLSA